MLKDPPKEKGQRLWLLSWFSGAGTHTFAPAKTPRGKTHELSGDQDRSFDLSEHTACTTRAAADRNTSSSSISAMRPLSRSPCRAASGAGLARSCR
jgi:hypothetical protein